MSSLVDVAASSSVSEYGRRPDQDSARHAFVPNWDSVEFQHTLSRMREVCWLGQVVHPLNENTGGLSPTKQGKMGKGQENSEKPHLPSTPSLRLRPVCGWATLCPAPWPPFVVCRSALVSTLCRGPGTSWRRPPFCKSPGRRLGAGSSVAALTLGGRG